MRLPLGLLLTLLLVLPAAAASSKDYRLLRIGGYYLKWGEPAFGQGAEVSYGFATSPVHFNGAINCGRLAPVARLAPGSPDRIKRFERIVAEAFAMWSGSGDLAFRRAAPGERADILIGAQGEPHRIAFANVWHDAEAAVAGVAPLVRATICLNPLLAWSTEGRVPRKGMFDLRIVLAHEIGHAIGLDHPGATGSLMGYREQVALTGLQDGDAAGVTALYGAAAPGPAHLVANE